jgi:hypothetical protein
MVKIFLFFYGINGQDFRNANPTSNISKVINGQDFRNATD